METPIYSREQIARELNKVIPERADKAINLLRTLLTLAATLLTILLPLSLFAGLSQPIRICLLAGGLSLFLCVVASIAGLCYQNHQLAARYKNLTEYWRNYEEYSELPTEVQAGLLAVRDGGVLEKLTATALICLGVALGTLLATLFQILLS